MGCTLLISHFFYSQIIFSVKENVISFLKRPPTNCWENENEDAELFPSVNGSTGFKMYFEVKFDCYHWSFPNLILAEQHIFMVGVTPALVEVGE